MNRIGNLLSKKFYLLAIATFLSVGSFAQGTPCDPGGDPDNVPNNPCPIDGGLSLLIAAGIGIGAKKAHAERKRQAVKIQL